MARFVFRLESVLKQREREEQFCQAALAEALGVQAGLEAKIAQIEQEVRRETESLRTRMVGHIDTTEILRHRRYLAACAIDVARISQELANARLRVEASRRKLTDAAKRRKALELLRDKQKAEFNSEFERKHQIELDEVSMQIAFADMNPTAA
ncbi:MAG TPA: flagellar export protein FliJ [Tepidisphaeraceae bacterium]|nr:flagellar export protein FliJ [Tepidisphaeraceae bacterium]